MQERYDLLSRLMMKHRVNDFEELITLRDSLKEKVNAFENINEAIAKAEKELKDSEKQLSQARPKPCMTSVVKPPRLSVKKSRN